MQDKNIKSNFFRRAYRKIRRDSKKLIALPKKITPEKTSKNLLVELTEIQATPLADASTLTEVSTPILSIIIPVYNVEGFVAETLDSLLKQSLKNWEAIVVDDGSTDGSGQIIAQYAIQDSRIRIITKSNGGLGAARNTGIRSARGTYLTFLDSDDTLPPLACAQLVDSLESSGSDFAVGSVRRVTHGKFSTPHWVKITHSESRKAICIDDFPLAMQDIIACNRMFRTSFWTESIGDFPEGIAYEDHAPMVAAYVRASKFDLLKEVTYNWRIREDKKSIGQQKHDVQNLIDRVTSKSEAFKVLCLEGTLAAKNAWLGRVVDLDIPAFVNFALEADDNYRRVAQEFASEYIAKMTPEAWSYVRFMQRIRVLLMSLGQWDLLPKVEAYIRDHGAIESTRVLSGRIIADLSQAPGGLDALMPPESLVIHERLSPMRARIEKLDWTSEGLQLSGWVFIPYVDSRELSRQCSFTLKNMSNGRIISINSENVEDAQATIWSQHQTFNYENNGFSLLIRETVLDALCSEDPGSTWQLIASIEVEGVRREGAIHSLNEAGSPGWLRSGPLSTNHHKVIPLRNATDGFVLVTREEPALLTSSKLGERTGLLRNSVIFHESFKQVPKTFKLTFEDKSIHQVDLVEVSPSQYVFDLDLDEIQELRAGAQSIASVRIACESGPDRRLSWAIGVECEQLVNSIVQLKRSTHGYVDLLVNEQKAIVRNVSFESRKIFLNISLFGFKYSDINSISMIDIGRNLLGTFEAGPEGSIGAYFDLSAGDGSKGVVKGEFTVRVETSTVGTIDCSPSQKLLAQMPLVRRDPLDRVSIVHTGPKRGRLLKLLVSPAFSETEIGHFNQRRLVNQYQAASPMPRESILFQCYRGETAGDSQRAIHNELVKMKASIEIFWGVSHLGVEVPDGGTAVLIGSEQWYELLAASRYLCNNIDFERYFVRRPFQKFLQTFHGHPFKSMGISHWNATGVSSWRIKEELSRRAEAWTSILVANDESAEIYREQYDFDGDIIVAGYPRNDELVLGGSIDRKNQIRHRLGIDPDRKIVLFAPTWREVNATGAWSATMFDGLDVEELSGALGGEYVVLVRGHNFNQRTKQRISDSTSILDVTDYPEINDLIIVSDIAILDYSSLRFDFAITGKPMIFFVPDAIEYFSGRPPLIPFDETTPGAVVKTCDELAAEVLKEFDDPGRFGAELDKFNVRFNPISDGKSASRVIEKWINL